MRVFLMARDHDFDIDKPLPYGRDDVAEDLELNTVFGSMAKGDEFLFEVVKKGILSSLTDIDNILYRQDVLKDCIKNPEIVRALYDITIEAIEGKRKTHFGFFTKYPHSILFGAIETMTLFLDIFKKLRKVIDTHGHKFESEGFTRFFSMIKKELSDEYIKEVAGHLKELKFQNGMLISARLGRGNKGTDYTLCKPDKRSNWLNQFFSKKRPSYSFSIPERDESSARALSDLKDKGINLVADALAQSVDHITNFFHVLQGELGFYIGALNLYEEVIGLGGSLSFPSPLLHTKREAHLRNLYDLSLLLTMRQKVVGNDLDISGGELVIITGANQGGKSTFLRSIGIAQLMMQAGMFVPADLFSSNVSTALFTHFKREEDKELESGKLDEELVRMSKIIDNIGKDAMILFNESFASTNEREGSEIARQIVSALIESRIQVFFVTHLYEFANYFYNKNMPNTLFLRAERREDGVRTFKIKEGKPLPTSFGRDLYYKIFYTRKG